ncbi:MAG: NAD(P)-dependent oxidoreductase [Spirochaetaceae bacterium]|jgi:nucleoside-diphosphate-sugar epimerase|nr:NAD(P)-dependent oxidoreductase [Spirochaetaceae bacterium]
MVNIVTGAAGFLGQALVENLVSRGETVVATDYSPPKDSVIKRWAKNVVFKTGDIRDRKFVNSIIESGCGHVFHLAGVLTAGCDRDPKTAIEVNVTGTYNVLDAALAHGKKRVIFASTIGVYGRGLPQPITEEMKLEPDGWYGLTKHAAEEAGLLYVRRDGLDFRAVRFAAVTGPNRIAAGSASLFTSLIAEKAAKGEAYAIEVTPDTSYPVVYIKDAVNALLRLSSAKEAPARIYNIASGNVVVKGMVEYVRKKIPDARFSYAPDDGIMAVVSGYKSWTIDCSLAKQELGWEPSFGVNQMVNDIISQIKNNND